MDLLWDLIVPQHTLLIEKDDPYLDIFQSMGSMGLAKVHDMHKMGAESCANLVFDHSRFYFISN